MSVDITKYANITDIYNILFDFIKKQEWASFTEIIDKIMNYKTEDAFYNEIAVYFDINMRDLHNNYYINYAILYNSPNIVKYLIDKGSKLDVYDTDQKSILYVPIKYNYKELIDILIDNNDKSMGINVYDVRDKQQNVPLHYAVLYNNTYALDKLLSVGANTNLCDMNGYNVLHMAIFKQSEEMVSIILKYYINVNMQCNTGETGLHIACNLQLHNIIKMLIDAKININIQDYEHDFTALHYAVSIEDVDAVKILIDAGANPNIQDIIGNNALHYCMIDKSAKIFTLLIKCSINFNLWNNKGHIPLHIAIINDDYTKIDHLIGKSNLNIQDATNNTCLHLLCKNGIWKKYKKILENKKLDITLYNNEDMRPIDYITKDEIVDFIDTITKSYYHVLLSKSYSWKHDWENICKGDKDDKQILQKMMNKGEDKKATCNRIIKNKIKDMYENKIRDYCEKSYPINSSYICINVNQENKTGEICTFTGCSLDILCGLIYLLNKYPNTNSVISSGTSGDKMCKIYKSMGALINTKCEYIQFELLWTENKIQVTSDFDNNFLICIRNNKIRFVIIPLGIELNIGSHANYLIYDKQSNEIERFEPHGSHAPYGFNYNATMLDDTIEGYLKKLKHDISYIRPQNFIPKIGFQLLDIYESKNKKIGDPNGFCAVWAIWYVDMRLMYDKLRRDVLIQLMINAIRAKSLSFKNVIRTYAYEVVNIRDKILQEHKLDINSWINENYTDEQLTNVINSLKMLIFDKNNTKQNN